MREKNIKKSAHQCFCIILDKVKMLADIKPKLKDEIEDEPSNRQQKV